MKLNKHFIKTSLVIIVLLLVAIVCIKVANPLVKFATEPEKFRAWVNANGIWGRLAYIGMMVLQIVAVFFAR